MILELLKNKPYFLLLLAAISFLILSFIGDKNETLDINIHDTYYIISRQHSFILLCLIFLTTGLFYFVFDFLHYFYFKTSSRRKNYKTDILFEVVVKTSIFQVNI